MGSGGNSSIHIANNGTLQLGTGGATGNARIPIIDDGQLTFFHSDYNLNVSSPLSGSGQVFFRGQLVTGLSNSSYVLSSNLSGFNGNIVIGPDARLEWLSSVPAPEAKIVVLYSGSLWLSGAAYITSPISIEGKGWMESIGQLGALRLDNGTVIVGPVTLTDNARINAVYGGYVGTLSGVIGDDGKGYRLEKNGGGKIILSGNNTWAGGLLLSDGILSVATDNNLGATSGSIVFNGGNLEMTNDFTSNRALVVDSLNGGVTAAGTNTFAGGVSGDGILFLSGGTLALAGNDTRTGSTTINPGAQLQIGSGSVNGAAQGTLNGNVNNSGTLTFNRTGSSSYSGVLSGPGALIKQNSGGVNLSGAGSTQGSVAVNGGTLQFSPAGVFSVTGNLTTAAGAQTSVTAGSQLNISGAMTQQANSAFETSVDASQPAVIASAIALDGALKVNGAPVSATAITSKALTILHSPNASGITGDFTSLGFSNPADYLIVSGSKANNDQDYNLNFGLTWFAGQAQGNGVFTLVKAGDIFDINTELTDQTPPLASGWDGKTLTKAGTGTLILSQANPYSGSTLINGGTLQTNIANAFQASSDVDVGSGATLNLNNFAQQTNNLRGAGNITTGSATLTAINSIDSLFSGVISGTGSLVKTGLAALTLSGNNTFSGGISVNSGELIATSGQALGAGDVVNNSALTLDFSSFSRVQNLLSGNGTLNKSGNGIATLTKNGSSAGIVNVNSGALNLGSGVEFTSSDSFHSAAGAITGIGNGASLNVTNEFDLQGGLALVVGQTQPLIATNTATLGPQSTLNVAGLSLPDNITPEELFTYRYHVLNTLAANGITGDFSALNIGGATGPVDFAEVNGFKDILNQNYNVGVRLNWYAGNSSEPEAATGSFTLTNAIESFELHLPLINQSPNPVTAWDGRTLTKAGDGTLILSAHNLYTGSTLIQGGILQTGIENALAKSSDVQLAQGATFALEGFDQSINNFSGSGNVTLGDAQLSLNNNTDTLFDGVISGSGGVNKFGSSLMTFTGDNTYTGLTTISEGTLQLGNGGATGNVAGDIVDNSTLIFNHIQNMSWTNVISGTGAVIKNGANDLQFLTNQTWTGQTDVNSGSLILGDSPATAVTLGSSQVNIAQGATLGGYGEITGNVSNQGTLAVADAVPQFAEGAAGNLTIGGDLVNSGNIIMASPTPASTLTVNGNYQGNGGLLTLSTVLGDENSATDKLVILGNSSGNTQVKINNAGGSGAATINGIEIIHVAGQSDGNFALAGRVVAGAYDYFLQQGLPGAPNGNWYLRNQLPEPPVPPTPPGPPGPPNPTPPAPQTQVIRPEAGSYLANKTAASNMFTQRLEDRAGRAEDSSLWLRQIGTHSGAYDGSGQLKTTANSYMIQGGGELAQGSFFMDDRLGVGVMFGYGNAHNSTYANRSGYHSKGTVDGYSSGLYGTWYQNAKTLAGTYVDSWVQYSWFNAQVKGDQLDTEHYDINGFSGSVETGYRMGVYQGENSSVFVTPQAQLIWNGLQADSHRESNGTHIDYPDSNNLQSRLGVKLSRDGVSTRDKSSGKLFTTYVEANWLHNTDPVGVTLDDESVGLAGTRNIGEVKVGLEGKLSERLSVWGNVSQQMGGSGYSATSGLLGVDYRF